jgi:hypothetical protein
MLLAALLATALVQDPIDNPDYQGWKPFMPGSWVSHKLVRAGSSLEAGQKTTLKSITDAELVLDLEVLSGGKVIARPLPRRIPAKSSQLDFGPLKKEWPEEELEIGGKKLKCRIKEYERPIAAGKSIGKKIWIHEDIPGQEAKVETLIDGKVNSTLTATAWEKK